MHSLVYFVSQRLQFCQSKADTNNWLKGIKRKKRHGAGRDIKEIKEEKDKERNIKTEGIGLRRRQTHRELYERGIWRYISAKI